MKNLEREQALMRRRMARRLKAEKRKNAVRRVATQEQREFEILHALRLFAGHTATYDDLMSASAARPFGRGWWRKTFWDLEDAGLLTFVEIRGRDYVRLTKEGLSIVISGLDSAASHREAV